MHEDQPGWDGVERRIRTSAEVERWYRRERIKTILYSMLTTFVVALVVSLVLGHYLSVNAHNNALENCTVQADGRQPGNVRALSQMEVLDVAEAAFNSFPKKFRDAQNARIQADVKRFADRLPAGIEQRVHGFGDLAAELRILPLIDCSKTIQ